MLLQEGISAALGADGGRAVVARMDGDVVWKCQQDTLNGVDQRRVVAASSKVVRRN